MVNETPDADRPQGISVTRHEEQLSVAFPVQTRGGVRIRKVVTVETVTRVVQVRREELVVEELDVTELTPDARALDDGGEGTLAEDEFEIVLHEERVDLVTTVVPVERVRVRTRVVTDQVPLTASVRREQVELVHPAEDTDSSG